MKAAEATYGGFVTLIKYSIPVIVLITIVIVMLIA